VSSHTLREDLERSRRDAVRNFHRWAERRLTAEACELALGLATVLVEIDEPLTSLRHLCEHAAHTSAPRAVRPDQHEPGKEINS
jgi:hypothetical protein